MACFNKTNFILQYLNALDHWVTILKDSTIVEREHLDQETERPLKNDYGQAYGKCTVYGQLWDGVTDQTLTNLTKV
jgi:hypothetical protein